MIAICFALACPQWLPCLLRHGGIQASGKIWQDDDFQCSSTTPHKRIAALPKEAVCAVFLAALCALCVCCSCTVVVLSMFSVFLPYSLSDVLCRSFQQSSESRRLVSDEGSTLDPSRGTIPIGKELSLREG
jgi:hypothetical protein